jgi:hypothetical protein
MTKALIREIVLLIARLTDSTSAAILTIVSHKAYYAARRSRIHTGPEVPPDENGASDRPSGFARKFQMSQVRHAQPFCIPANPVEVLHADSQHVDTRGEHANPCLKSCVSEHVRIICTLLCVLCLFVFVFVFVSVFVFFRVFFRGRIRAAAA